MSWKSENESQWGEGGGFGARFLFLREMQSAEMISGRKGGEEGRKENKHYLPEIHRKHSTPVVIYPHFTPKDKSQFGLEIGFSSSVQKSWNNHYAYNGLRGFQRIEDERETRVKKPLKYKTCTVRWSLWLGQFDLQLKLHVSEVV